MELERIRNREKYKNKKKSSSKPIKKENK